MKKTILLSGNFSGKFSVIKWLFTSLAIFYILNGIENIVEQTSSDWKFWLGIALITLGSALLFYGLMLFIQPKKMLPRLEIDDTSIIIREDVFVRTKTFNWNSINQVLIKPYMVEFVEDKKNIKRVLLKTEKTIAKQIQEAIKEAAGARAIPVFES